ncbi:uncharacterized protein DNG_05913 [Cephalotrichum gorgonifer]|uniref:DUF6594 domain-containing protein n=1 Tax=Cephalotrichum gorgonifer TaxID=2041049 RepID=A0AAE8MYP7_9PEZI|nr:uncharacterized protein DNG_05913 [Cephalotrichum gorgonifer]
MSPRSTRRQRVSPQPAPYQKEGYAAVAHWVSLDRDNEGFVFRKFDELAARNLLYLQSEILHLEGRLRELDEQDVASDDMALKDAARTWEVLVEKVEAGDDAAKKRMRLIEDVRMKLKEYHERLLLQSEIAKLPRPSKRVLAAYRGWFKTPPALGGRAKTFLDDRDDLVATNNAMEADYLSRFLRQHWPAKEDIPTDGCYVIGRFNEDAVRVAVGIINTIVAAVLLVGPISGLYLVQSDKSKLAMIAAFTATFALTVGLLTNARRAEIFGATAAYAAVLVVFVSGDLSSS